MAAEVGGLWVGRKPYALTAQWLKLVRSLRILTSAHSGLLPLSIAAKKGNANLSKCLKGRLEVFKANMNEDLGNLI